MSAIMSSTKSSVGDEPNHDNTSPAAALTTAFRMPVPCSSLSTKYEDIDCMPTNFSKSYWYGYAGYYSPAICPYGYTSACARPASASDGTPFGPPLDGGENAAICCPSDYNCWSGTESWCSSTSYTVTTITTSSYLYPTGTQATPTTYESSITPSAYALQVRWRDVDLENFETDPLKPGSKPTLPPAPSTASATSLPTSSSAANITSTNNGDSGLTTGSKIGIGVGIPIAALLLAALLFFLIRRRRARRNAAHLDSSGSGKDLPEVHYTPLSHTKGAANSTIRATPTNPLMRPSYRPSTQPPPPPPPPTSPPASAFPPPFSQPDYLPPSSPPKPYHHPSPPLSTSPPDFPSSGTGGGAAFAPAPAPASPPTDPTYTLPALSRDPLSVPGLPSSYAGSTTAISSGGGAAAFAPTGPRSEAGGSTGSAPNGDDAEEIAALRREAQRLQERRLRLTQMQQLDEEEERVGGRLRELEGRMG